MERATMAKQRPYQMLMTAHLPQEDHSERHKLKVFLGEEKLGGGW